MNDENTSEKKIYPSMKALSAEKGIPINILKMAKASGADGFNSNNSITWTPFSEWYESHKEELTKASSDTLEFFKKEIAKRDVLIRDEQLKKLRGEALDPFEVKGFLVRVGKAQETKLTSLPQEIVPKTKGLDEIQQLQIWKKAIGDVANLFYTELDKWIK